jgi:metal-sulfur cluster biosynthetic enzyme
VEQVVSREHQVREAINGIVDPCSTAMAEPAGIDDMGIVEHVRIDGDAVEVDLLPTSAHCLFTGLFEEEIEERVGALPWVGSVRVALSSSLDIWDESRMHPRLRERLRLRRQMLRA